LESDIEKGAGRIEGGNWRKRFRIANVRRRRNAQGSRLGSGVFVIEVGRSRSRFIRCFVLYGDRRNQRGRWGGRNEERRGKRTRTEECLRYEPNGTSLEDCPH
jgi:hypothetical protein